MTLPRSALVSLDATPYYHCIGRCVRRAFLCGFDRYSGRSFEHRRGWIVAKLAELASTFAIDVAGYAVMSNHYHLVLKINANEAETWTDRQVVNRWCRLFAGHRLVQRYQAGESLSPAELEQVSVFVATYRTRLADLSWFMRCLNESIARMANAEDGCTGRFWEGRFKSQALLDEAALIACMAYVDLNPIRAGMATTPEASDYTSIQQRIHASGKNRACQRQSASVDRSNQPEIAEEAIALPELMRFGGRMDHADELPLSLNDYLDLVDWSGRAIHPDKKGSIPDHYPKIIDRLGISPDALIQYVGRKDRGFRHVVGRPHAIRAAAEQLGRAFLHGISTAQRLFPTLA